MLPFILTKAFTSHRCHLHSLMSHSASHFELERPVLLTPLIPSDGIEFESNDTQLTSSSISFEASPPFEFHSA